MHTVWKFITIVSLLYGHALAFFWPFTAFAGLPFVEAAQEAGPKRVAIIGKYMLVSYDFEDEEREKRFLCM